MPIRPLVCSPVPAAHFPIGDHSRTSESVTLALLSHITDNCFAGFRKLKPIYREMKRRNMLVGRGKAAIGAHCLITSTHAGYSEHLQPCSGFVSSTSLKRNDE